MDTTRSRISIELVKEGMTTEEAVIDQKGTILIPQNTVLTYKHILQLESYKILSVVIKDPTGEYKDATVNIVPPNQPINLFPPEDEEFIQFKEDYQRIQNEVENQIINIGNGNEIKPKVLFDLTANLMTELKTQSALFNYLYTLRDSDDHTFSHSLNVALLANVFSKWLNLSDHAREELTVAGLLHDIGKTLIDHNLLIKPGKLTIDEFNAIKKHTSKGYQLICDQPLSNNIKQAILMHHERNDGSGYPLGLKAKDIHHYAKILAICDIYDAMTSNRPYHEKFSPFNVMRIFKEESYGQLDTKYLLIFLQNIAYNYVGKMVQLSNNQTGKIIFINPKYPSKPLIQTDSGIIDLGKELNIVISDLV